MKRKFRKIRNSIWLLNIHLVAVYVDQSKLKNGTIKLTTKNRQSQLDFVNNCLTNQINTYTQNKKQTTNLIWLYYYFCYTEKSIES